MIARQARAWLQNAENPPRLTGGTSAYTTIDAVLIFLGSAASTKRPEVPDRERQTLDPGPEPGEGEVYYEIQPSCVC